MAALRRALSLVACAAARPAPAAAAPCAVRSFAAAAAASEASSSSSAAASGVGAAPAASPGYTITDAPGLAPESGAAAKAKWGRYVLKGIKGHTKKLNPIARQVRTAGGGLVGGTARLFPRARSCAGSSPRCRYLPLRRSRSPPRAHATVTPLL
jgi:hypothetical protein